MKMETLRLFGCMRIIDIIISDVDWRNQKIRAVMVFIKRLESMVFRLDAIKHIMRFIFALS